MRLAIHQRINDWLSERELGSNARAGRWAATQARKRHYDYVRRNWWRLLVLVGGCLALSPLLLFLPSWVRPFGAGALLATAVWLAIVNVVLVSGTAAMIMGESGEQFTVEELRSLRRRGWRVANHVILRPKADIDHLAIGPGGVLVIETKWSGSPWGERWARDERIPAARAQVARNAHDVGMVLRTALNGAPVRALVVLWGPMGDVALDQSVMSRDGVEVVHGTDLRRWLDELSDEGLFSSDADNAWDRIVTHVRRRDRADLEKFGKPRLSVADIATQTSLLLFGLLAGMLLPSYALTWLDWRMGFAFIALFIVGAAEVRRISVAKRFADGLLFGVIFISVALVASVTLYWLRA